MPAKVKPTTKSEFYREGSFDKRSVFVKLLERYPVKDDASLNEVFQSFDKLVVESAPEIPPSSLRGALNNAHGDWYEWMLALAAWKVHTEANTPYVAVLLPNVKAFDVADLYVLEIRKLIEDLRHKVAERAAVKLVTSNPDFAIIDTTKTVNLPKDLEMKYDDASVSELVSFYKHFVGKCSLDALVGFASVKTSFRPDRRLQIPHEGSLMKAIYTHIQTRQWIINPPGLKYYALVQAPNQADRDALQTVATHSITTVQSEPQAAVDAVYAVDSLNMAREAFSSILNSKKAKTSD